MTADIDTVELALMFATLEVEQPITNRYMTLYDQQRGITRPLQDQREHMLNWFISQKSLGSGPYSRKQPNHSAKTTYNRLLTAPGLLWIAEAMGQCEDILLAACDEILGYSLPAKICGTLRRATPWSRIYELAAGIQLRQQRLDNDLEHYDYWALD